MSRCLALACMIALAAIGGCDLPAPAQYDDAMLREHFGKSSEEVEEAFGEPKSVSIADYQIPPEITTEEERKQFYKSTEGASYQYSTPDGDLVFHFNLNFKVHGIIYSGRNITPAP